MNNEQSKRINFSVVIFIMCVVKVSIFSPYLAKTY